MKLKKKHWKKNWNATQHWALRNKKKKKKVLNIFSKYSLQQINLYNAREN